MPLVTASKVKGHLLRVHGFGRHFNISFAIILVFNVISHPALAQYKWIRDYYDFDKKFVKQAYRISHATDKKQGPFYGYYPNGTLQSAGEYDADKQIGLWHYYFQNGSPKAIGIYKHAAKNGAWSYFYENGTLSQQGLIKDGKRSDLWKFYYENGAVKSEGVMKDDIAVGLWKYYNEDASLKGQTLFKGQRGVHEEYYLDGKLKMVGLLKDGVSDSVWTYYYANGQLKAQGGERNGRKYGPWKFYFENGTLQSEGNFEDNLEQGAWKYYHINGQVSSDGVLLKGKKDGNWNLYYESGRFMGEGKFAMGEGQYREYYDDGKLKTEGRIKDADYEGLWKYYFNDGTLEGECTYALGEGIYTGFYPDGTRKISGTLKNGQKTGVWRLYDPDGSLNGLYKTYFDKTELVRIDAQPIVIDSVKDIKRRRKRGQVALIMPGHRNHFFNSRINEPKGFVLLANPAALIYNQLPISCEYYFDQRLGYEIGIIANKSPLVSVHSEDIKSTFNTVFQKGVAVLLRQKLYWPSHRYGSTFFAQELRYSYNNFQASHRILVQDSVIKTVISTGYEQKFEFSLLLGKRFVKDQNQDHTIVLDLFIGLGAGYRLSSLPIHDTALSTVPTRRFTLPLRAGFMFGYFF